MKLTKIIKTLQVFLVARVICMEKIELESILCKPGGAQVGLDWEDHL
jgi:hypothetical protein